MNAEIASTRSHLDDEHRLFAASLDPAPLSDEERSELAQMQARRDADEQFSREADEQAEALRRQAQLLLEGRSTSETWKELLKKAGVEPRFLAKLLGLARPAAVLVGVRSSSPLTCGASKLGGEPDLPKDVLWPRFKGRPLSFVVQISLSHLPAAVRESLSLPAVGMVSFFYESGQQPWGYDPEDRGAACVIFSPRIDALTSTAPPPDLPEDRKYSELEFGVREQTSMPALVLRQSMSSSWTRTPQMPTSRQFAPSSPRVTRRPLIGLAAMRCRFRGRWRRSAPWSPMGSTSAARSIVRTPRLLPTRSRPASGDC